MPKFEISSEGGIKASPLVKWPGGKRALIRDLMPILPRTIHRYFEPFFGGGALFFALQPPMSFLSDTNEELINLYTQVREEPAALIRQLKQHRNSESDYYAIRDQRPRSPLRRAARLLYLTTLSFNGIHRVNLQGQFNVPYGYKTHLETYDEERLLSVARALQFARLRVADFQLATEDAGMGDLVYFDLPYTVAHAHNGFLKYNEKIFSWDDQVRLASHARALASRGCNVVVSNATHPSVDVLYKGFDSARIGRVSRIAASASHRRKITETVYFARG
jgi:DNA adenine methylase